MSRISPSEQIRKQIQRVIVVGLDLEEGGQGGHGPVSRFLQVGMQQLIQEVLLQ